MAIETNKSVKFKGKYFNLEFPDFFLILKKKMSVETMEKREINERINAGKKLRSPRKLKKENGQYWSLNIRKSFRKFIPLFLNFLKTI